MKNVKSIFVLLNNNLLRLLQILILKYKLQYDMNYLLEMHITHALIFC